MKQDETIRVISVQDISCFGSCSQSVSHAILCANGIETAMLPTAILSTHTGGFSGVTCLDLTEEMGRIIAHWKREGLRFDGVLSGYVSNADQIGAIRSLRELLEENALFVVDPAMADHGKMYHGLGEEVLQGMRELVSVADVILPNLTEAALLLGRSPQENMTEEETRELLQKLTELGPGAAVITGVDMGEGMIGAVGYDRKSGQFAAAAVERLGAGYPGTGDIFAAVFTASCLNGDPLQESLQKACDFVKECIAETMSDETHRYGVKFEKVLARMHR